MACRLQLAIAALGCVGCAAAAPSYNASVARTLALYASATQCNASALAAWDCPACLAANAAFEVSRIVYDAPTDSLAVVGWDAALPAVLVVFRATMTASLVDWLEDFALWQTGFAGAPGCPAGAACAVHAGFDAVFGALSGEVLAAAAAAAGAHPGAGVLVAGHSLGGALATLGGGALAASGAAPVEGVYTFGSPRVGNAAFALHYYDALLGNVTWRVTHALDAVPQFPPRCALPARRPVNYPCVR